MFLHLWLVLWIIFYIFRYTHAVFKLLRTACVADGVSECSTTLDDSVSEEEESSYDELSDATPYLEPGVELSVLIEVRLGGKFTCHV